METLGPPIWNAFCSSIGTEKWGSGGEETSSPPRLRKREVGAPGEGFLHPPGVVSVCNSVCQPLHELFGGGVRRNLNLEMRQQFETKCNERSELHADWGRGW